jgi:predicted RNA-binding protein YlqC (UPF0109 family)
MGRKVHPVGFRLKIIRDWDARWYAEGQRYVDLLHEDLAIRRFIKTDPKLELARAGISRIEIERYPNQLLVNIHTARPGIIIGRKGEKVKELRTALEAMTRKKVKVEVNEIEKPDLDSTLVAENIASQWCGTATAAPSSAPSARPCARAARASRSWSPVVSQERTWPAGSGSPRDGYHAIPCAPTLTMVSPRH